MSEATLNGRMPKVKSKVETPAREKGSSSHLRRIERWGTRYVIAACVLSSGLNAWANVDMCVSDSLLACSAAGILGAVIPGLAWMLSKIAGHAYRAGRKRLACMVGIAAVSLLVLSIWHCAHAIALLTGGGVVLSSLLAVGIDYGLVASETASVLSCD